MRLSGEADPWGLAYKTLSSKLKKSTQIVSMQSENMVLTRPNEICEFILMGLLSMMNITQTITRIET